MGSLFGNLGPSWGGLGASWGILETILNDLALSCAISEAILDSLRPSWSRLGPSWTFQLPAKPMASHGCLKAFSWVRMVCNCSLMASHVLYAYAAMRSFSYVVWPSQVFFRIHNNLPSLLLHFLLVCLFHPFPGSWGSLGVPGICLNTSPRCRSFCWLSSATACLTYARC